jgi:hypothetical protein
MSLEISLKKLPYPSTGVSQWMDYIANISHELLVNCSTLQMLKHHQSSLLS